MVSHHHAWCCMGQLLNIEVWNAELAHGNVSSSCTMGSTPRHSASFCTMTFGVMRLPVSLQLWRMSMDRLPRHLKLSRASRFIGSETFLDDCCMCSQSSVILGTAHGRLSVHWPPWGVKRGGGEGLWVTIGDVTSGSCIWALQ